MMFAYLQIWINYTFRNLDSDLSKNVLHIFSGPRDAQSIVVYRFFATLRRFQDPMMTVPPLWFLSSSGPLQCGVN